MKKIYTAFISSVYSELIDERDCVIETMLDLDVLPICMEHFAVSDTGRFEDIKKRIDDSDFVILILGNRFGSRDSDGKSWTQKEYEYACERSIPTLALKTADWCQLEARFNDPAAFGTLTKDEIEQVQFGKDILAERAENYKQIMRAVTTFLIQCIKEDDNLYAGWIRGSSSVKAAAEEKEWMEKNGKLNLSKYPYLFHLHMIPNDKSYLRIGTIKIDQIFDKEHFSQVFFTGNNFAAIYDKANDRLCEIFSKRTEWTGKYLLQSNGKIDAGVYNARKYDTDKYGKMQVTPGVRRGFHDFELIGTEELFMRGTFHDEVSDDLKTGGKAGQIYIFTSEEKRLQYMKRDKMMSQILEQITE